jgi:hypothetical protein
MDKGQIIESGEPGFIFTKPRQARTAKFLKAVLEPESLS